MILITLLSLSPFLSIVHAAIGPVTNLPIVNKVIAPDGFSRSTVLAGGTYPGSVITGNKGTQFKINVQDRLTDSSMLKSTSIHWHGFLQKGSNWADGGAFVNQCPIAPGDDFEYRFNAPNQAGTFWYHSHLSTQYCDGLRGAMVVYDQLDINRLLYDVDNEDTIITLSDWYHTVAPQQPLPAIPESTLINGKGRYPGGPAAPLAVINVQKGRRYRFRLVSLSCDPNFLFSIEGHDMTIIAIDSINVIPKKVNEIRIFAGQRFDFVLNAIKEVKNYHVRALPNVGPPGFSGGVNSAVLRYNGAPNAEPTFTAGTATKPLVEKDLRPQNPLTWLAPGLPKPDGADVNINLNFGFDFTTFKFTINGKSFVHPEVPVLLQILSGKQNAQDLLPEGLVIPLPPNKSIQLSLPASTIGGIGGPHPFHMHGHSFHVVRAAGQSDYNFLNPPQRDVVNTGGAGDNVTIRFRTDNPGPWFLHCHIDWHLETGLALVFAEDTGITRNQDPPPAWDALCPKYNALDPSDH